MTTTSLTADGGGSDALGAAANRAAAPSAGALFLPAAATLARREIVRFFRQRSRIMGAVSSPLLFWLLIGSGLNSSFRLGAGATGTDLSYMTYFYVGITAMVILFTSILSMISIIEDRKEGFLQGVLVSPAPRSAIVVGKIAGGTAIAMIQGAFFLLLAPLAGFSLTPMLVAKLLAMLFLISFSLTGLGYLLAWRMESTQGFHVMLNMVLMPMWILSGAVFPYDGATVWVKALMLANPLTYGVDALRTLFHEGHSVAYASALWSGWWTNIAIVALFGILTIAVSAAWTRRPLQ